MDDSVTLRNTHNTLPLKSSLRHTSVIMHLIVERSTLYMCAT